LKQRPTAEAAGNVSLRSGKGIDGLDLATGSNERHPPARSSNVELMMGVGFLLSSLVDLSRKNFTGIT
jgi:hypothetical protein